MEADLLCRYAGDPVIGMTLRSVEGMIFQLGEYKRDPTTSPKIHGGSRRVTDTVAATKSDRTTIQIPVKPCVPLLPET